MQDQTVTDERGLRRFHGAFTGGFSAGYFNTVGSKQGERRMVLVDNVHLIGGILNIINFTWLYITYVLRILHLKKIFNIFYK